jgi:predicted ArsR family transcriptional regulator
VKLSRHQAMVEAQLSRVASLREPVRCKLYRYVIAQDEPVNREQAATEVKVAHHVAKFHLDRLEEDGLLQAEYRRPTGRTGPGAGRPAKYYRPSAQDVQISLPERHYDLAGRLMAAAISGSSASGIPVPEALHKAARAAGQELGRQAAHPVAGGPERSELVGSVCDALEDLGYEPEPVPGCITLANCPFHALARDYTELVCGMNLDLITGLLDSAGDTGLHARLDPASGRCCVTLRTEGAAGAG